VYKISQLPLGRGPAYMRNSGVLPICQTAIKTTMACFKQTVDNLALSIV
jgi:hypothetical protein